MSKPDIKGLEKLAAHLRQVPRTNFAMDHWFIPTECGTTGCIAGHAAVLFPRRLKLVQENNTWGTVRFVASKKQTSTHGEAAFADAFNLTYNDANDLCYHPAVNTPKQAAKAVMALVGKLKKEMKVTK